MKISIKAALEQVQEENLESTFQNLNESIEFSNENIIKGLEAIDELNKLATVLEKQEKNNVSLESYNDFALITLNNIRQRIGLEEDSGNVTSEKTNSFIDTLIETLKKIAEKLYSFIVDFFKNVLFFISSQKQKITKLKSALENSISEAFISEVVSTKRHYFDLDSISETEVFNSDYYANYENNIKTVSQFIEKICSYIKSDDFLDPKNFILSKIPDLERELINKIHGKTVSIFNKKYKDIIDVTGFLDKSRKVSPDGIIGYNKKTVEDLVNKVTLPIFIKLNPVSNSEQITVKPLSKSKAISYCNELIDKIDSFESILEDIRSNIEKIIKDTIPTSIKTLKENGNKRKKEDNELGIGSALVGSILKESEVNSRVKTLNGLSISLMRLSFSLIGWEKDFVDSAKWYLSFSLSKEHLDTVSQK